MMPRDSLKPFRNRLVTVSGQVVLMHHGGRYGRYPFHNNTRMLLRDLMIEGQPIDHIWLKVPQRYYNKRRSIINQRVKFKAKIVPYVKKGMHGFIQEYGLQKRSGFTIIKGNHEEILDHEEKYFDEELTVEFFLKEP